MAWNHSCLSHIARRIWGSPRSPAPFLCSKSTSQPQGPTLEAQEGGQGHGGTFMRPGASFVGSSCTYMAYGMYPRTAPESRGHFPSLHRVAHLLVDQAGVGTRAECVTPAL